MSNNTGWSDCAICLTPFYWIMTYFIQIHYFIHQDKMLVLFERTRCKWEDREAQTSTVGSQVMNNFGMPSYTMVHLFVLSTKRSKYKKYRCIHYTKLVTKNLTTHTQISHDNHNNFILSVNKSWDKLYFHI